MLLQTEPHAKDVLDIIYEVFRMIAWPSLVLLAWKVSRWFLSIENKFTTTADALLTKMDLMSGQLNLMANNHLVHVQAAVEEAAKLEDEGHRRIVDELKELRADIRASRQ